MVDRGQQEWEELLIYLGEPAHNESKVSQTVVSALPLCRCGRDIVRSEKQRTCKYCNREAVVIPVKNICTKCRQHPRYRNQSWCHECFSTYHRERYQSKAKVYTPKEYKPRAVKGRPRALVVAASQEAPKPVQIAHAITYTPAAKHAEDLFALEVWACLPKLKGAAWLVGLRDPDAIEDAAMEAIVRAIRFKGQFVFGTNLVAWVCAILRNYISSERRRAWRKQELSEDHEKLIPDDAANNQESASELAQVLATIRGCLTDDMRESLMMLAGGMSYGETAEKLGIAEGTVKSRVARARCLLRMELQQRNNVKEFMPAIGRAREECLAEMRM